MTSIARSTETQGDLIDWWNDAPLKGDVDVTLRPAEVAVFVREGEVLLELPPGRHRLTAQSHPVLAGWLSGKDHDLGIAFLTIGLRTEVDVGIGYTWGEQVEAFVATTATITVQDGSKAIGLLEHLDDEESLEDWLGDEIATQLADAIGELDVPDILHVTSQAHDADLVEAALAKANDVLGAYGVRVEALGDLTHHLDPDTEKRIKAELLKKAGL